MTELAYLALGSKSNPTYGMLSKRAEALFSNVGAFLTSSWSNANSAELRKLRSIAGCLDKLSAFLMQAYRMRKYHGALLDFAQKFNHFGNVPLPIVMSWAKVGREECADFESSLLQARAALDRLTWFVTDQIGQPSSSFSSIENILNKSNKPTASSILRFVRESTHLKISIVGPGNPDPLRDFVAHKGAASEITANCFAIYYFGGNLVLICDCELGDAHTRLPVFRTSYQLCRDVPYVVLNSLAIMCDIEPVARQWFEPNWRLVSVVLSDFVRDENSELQLNIIKRMTPSGFEATMMNVDREVLKHRVKVDAGPASFTMNLGEPQ